MVTVTFNERIFGFREIEMIRDISMKVSVTFCTLEYIY